MAKPETQDGAGMDRAELKRHLRFALEEPVSIAFALGADGKAVLQMHRRKPGRALEKQLKDAAPDSKNHRWGTAMVDPEDAKLVRFTVNKAAGGMARRLVVALKGTGFNKVRLMLDDGTELEGHEEEDATPPEPDDASGGTTEQDASASAPSETPAADPATTPTADAQAADQADAGGADGSPDAATLSSTLTGLVKTMLGVVAKDPSQKAALVELATDAQASLKRGDLQQAAAGIDIFRQALDAASSNADAARATPDPTPDAAAQVQDGKRAAPVIAKARHAWMATRKRVEADVDGLHKSFSSALNGHDMADELVKAFRGRVDTMMDTLDESLAHTLDGVNKAQDATERAKLVDQAHALIRRHQAHIASDRTIALLDSNPFVPMKVQMTMTATLDALSKAIR